MPKTSPTSEDERWIARCLELAREAAANDEVPAHAEMEALQAALAKMGEKRLPDAELYSTLEPCFLCAGAILHTRVRRVVFGARDPKFGAVRSLGNVLEDERLNHRCVVLEGVQADESAELLRSFFRKKR
jgi:tRNA(adenine34) deaminase